MLKSLNKYIRNNEYSINIWENFININNFDEIIILENNRVSLLINNKTITIKGENLVINKLLDKEILISGDFNSIILGDSNV